MRTSRPVRRVALSGTLLLLVWAGWPGDPTTRGGRAADSPSRAPLLRQAAHPDASAPVRSSSRAIASSPARSEPRWRVEVPRTAAPLEDRDRDRSQRGSRPPSERASGSEIPRLTLDRLVERDTALAIRPTGFDRRAPRPIELWRVTETAAAVVARGESRADGEMVFPQLVVPRDGIRLVAAPEGEGPDGPSASTVRELPPRAPVAPRARVSTRSTHQAVLRLLPVETTGAVLVAEPSGEELGRWPVRPGPVSRVLEVRIDVPADRDLVWLIHELDDGRRSEPAVLALPPVS